MLYIISIGVIGCVVNRQVGYYRTLLGHWFETSNDSLLVTFSKHCPLQLDFTKGGLFW